LPSFAPKIRVEVYVPVRYDPAYQDTLTWLIDEFTELRGGCELSVKISKPDISPPIPYNHFSFTIGGDRLRQEP